MAAFNAADQDANYQAPDFSRSSKGRDPTDWGPLFKGLSNAVSGIAGVVDSGIKNSINTKLETAYDKTNNEFGVDSATDMQADPALAKQPSPPEIQRAGENLKSLTTAYNSGQLKGDYYWMRMQSVVRSLRAQYPGYRDEIDQKVSSLTGGTPANQIRMGLEQEAAKEQSRADSADAVRYKLREDAAKLGITPSEILKSNDSQLQVRVWQEQSKKARVERDNAQFDLELKAGQATKQDAIKNAQGELDNLGDSIIANKFGAIAGSSSIGDLLKQAQADGATPTPEHVQALEAAFGTLTTQAAAEAQKIISQPRYRDLGPDERKKLLDGVQERFAQMKDLISSKEYGIATFAARMNELITTTEANKILSRDEIARTVAGMKAVGGDAFVQGLVTANPDNLKKYYQMLTIGKTGGVVSGNEDLNKSMTDLAAVLKGDTPQMTGKVLHTHLTQILGALRTDNPELFKSTAKMVYKDPSFLSLFDAETKANVLKQLTSGDIAKKALADPETKLLLEKFTGRAFTALAQPALTSLKEAVENGSATIKFDAGKGAFEVVGTIRPVDPANPLQLPGRRGVGYAPNQIDKYGVLAKKAADDLNALLPTVAPIINQTGTPMQEQLQRYFLGLGLPQEQVDSIFQSAAQGKSPDETNKKTSDNATENRDRLGIEGGDFNQLATIGMDDEALKKLQKTVTAKWDAGGARSIEPVSTAEENRITNDVNYRGMTAAHKMIQTAEAPGGFNSVWGGQVPGLTNMTIAEVLKKQSDLVRKQGRPSSAAGAFQYMPGTIQELIKAGVITPDDTFNEETQIKMANYSMEKAGLSAFMAGDLPIEDFQNNLAKIWAGLPTTSGKSYYESRLNHATVSVAFVQRSLEALRQGGVQDLTKGVEAVSEPVRPLAPPPTTRETPPGGRDYTDPNVMPEGTTFAPGTTGMDQSQAGKPLTPAILAEYKSVKRGDRGAFIAQLHTLGYDTSELFNEKGQ